MKMEKKVLQLYSSEISATAFGERGVMVHLNGLGYLYIYALDNVNDQLDPSQSQ